MGVWGFDFVGFIFPEENYFLALGCLPSVKISVSFSVQCCVLFYYLRRFFSAQT